MKTLKEKIARAMQADFIGDIVFNEDEIDTMKKECLHFIVRHSRLGQNFIERKILMSLSY